MNNNEDALNFTPKQGLLLNKVVLITGATGGIGEALSIKCAQLGATVIISGKSIQNLEALHTKICAQGFIEPLIYPADLEGASKSDFEALASTIEEKFGHLDGLILNAAILGDLTPLDGYSQEKWNQVIQINVTSQFLMTQCLIPVLKKASSASVIFSSSSVGRIGKAYWGAYSISKFAIEALVQIWASEHENVSSIRFNAVNPGATQTKMRAMAYPAENPRMLPRPSHIISPYIYLLSAESLKITGQSFNAQLK